MSQGLLAAVLGLLGLFGSDELDLEKSVVTLQVTYQATDEDRPWAKYNPGNREAFAAVVEGDLLLTLAQMVEDATLVRVERLGNGQLFDARVVHVDYEINLALVAVDAPEFFDGLRPVRFGAALPTEGSVRSVRWQDGQLELSTSRVARVEVAGTRFGNVEHAFSRVRTDVSGGGWSEPVFREGELVGLTSSQEDDQRASIMPPEILDGYVTRVKRGNGRGFASLGIDWQTNRDRSLAAYLGLGGVPSGVVVRGVRPGGSACGVLRPRDVLLELGGHAIDGVGNYEHPRYGRIDFNHIAVDGVQPGDSISARVLRDGMIADVELKLVAYPSDLRLIPWRRVGPPPYLVAGGLAFRELDGGYLRTWGADWASQAPLELVRRFFLEAHAQRPDRRRIVVVASVLPDRYNLGYHDLADRVVESVNGLPIDSISGAVEAFGRPKDGFHTVVLARSGDRRQVVLDAEAFEAASQRILDDYGISQAMRPEPPSSDSPPLDCAVR